MNRTMNRRRDGSCRTTTTGGQATAWGCVVDTVQRHPAVRVEVEHVQAARLLGDAPVGRQRQVQGVQQQRAVDAVVSHQHHGVAGMTLQQGAKTVGGA